MTCKHLQTLAPDCGTIIAVSVADQQLTSAAKPTIAPQTVDGVDLEFFSQLTTSNRGKLLRATLKVLGDKINIPCSRGLRQVMEYAAISFLDLPGRPRFIGWALFSGQDIEGIGLIQVPIGCLKL